MANRIDSSFIENYFPTLSKMTYLNNASMGIPPVTMADAISEYIRNRMRAAGSFDQTLALLKEDRILLASLLGGNYSQYGLVPSTSQAVNSFAQAIDYPNGSNIVICNLEFPSNYIPWQNVSRLYDVELRVVRSKNGAATPEMFKDLIDENTRVVAVSLVQFASGFKTDLRELANAVHEVGGYLFSDIIQAAGWADLDLVRENVDCAAGQAAKWLLGPIGAGYIYLREGIEEDLTPRFLGWWGVEKLTEFEYFERVPLKDVRMFQVGSPVMMAYVGLKESLKVLLEIPNDIRETIAMSNADYLRERLSEETIDHYDFGEKYNSTIVSCSLPDVEKVFERLTKEQVHVSLRNGRLRISPHFYNTEDEIERVISLLR